MLRYFLRSGLIAFIAIMILAAQGVAYANNSELLGTLVGAGVGGFVGNQFGRDTGNALATTTGIFLGGALGNQIGQIGDHTDRPAPAYYNNYNNYQPQRSVYYAPAYVPNYVAPPDLPPIYIDQTSQNYCREYSETVRIDNQIRESYGVACLQPDGSWRVQQ